MTIEKRVPSSESLKSNSSVKQSNCDSNSSIKHIRRDVTDHFFAATVPTILTIF